MGTNYYLQPKLTDQERVTIEKFNASLPQAHIGKSSWGWTFSFHATDAYDLEDLVGLATTEGLPHRCESAREWMLWTDCGEFDIIDEYRQIKTRDEFWDLIESKRCEKNHHARKYPDHSFTDADGHSFSRREFC